MENKEIIKFLEGELETFTKIYGEIEKPKDYINFIKTLDRFKISLKNIDLGIPYGTSITEIIEDQKEMKSKLVNLRLIENNK